MLVGVTGNVKYKGFTLAMVLDGRFGATVVNGTKRVMMSSGYSWESVKMREAGPVVFNGVIKDGYQDTETPTANSIAVRLGDLASGYAGGDANWVEKDINYLRVAEVRLQYTLNKDMLNKYTKGLISSASIFTSGSDLYVFTNYSGIDVTGNSNSSSMGGTGGVGFDVFAIAPPRGISFGINVSF